MIDETREISMNEPLDYGKFTFYQSSFREATWRRRCECLDGCL